jgi:hypothetical protein
MKLRTLLDAIEQRIRESGGMTHDEVWREVDAAYDVEPTNKEKRMTTAGSNSRRRRSAPKRR